jgi:deoxyadenosine/deoxycytidine kinase
MPVTSIKIVLFKQNDKVSKAMSLSNFFTPRPEEHRKYTPLIGSLIIIDGVISVGKTTAGRSIEKYLNSIGLKTQFFPEPIDKEHLNLYIEDMQKEAFGFQMVMLHKRLHLYEKALEFAASGGISFVDRSLVGDTIFAEMQIKKGIFTDKQARVYRSVLYEQKPLEPSATLFLKCDPETSLKRLFHRGETSEVQGYTMAYLSELCQTYNEAMKTLTHPVIEVDWNDHDILGSRYLSDSSVIFLLDALIQH